MSTSSTSTLSTTTSSSPFRQPARLPQHFSHQQPLQVPSASLAASPIRTHLGLVLDAMLPHLGRSTGKTAHRRCSETLPFFLFLCRAPRSAPSALLNCQGERLLWTESEEEGKLQPSQPGSEASLNRASTGGKSHSEWVWDTFQKSHQERWPPDVLCGRSFSQRFGRLQSQHWK